MSKSDIPPGYSLAITSWENDADCYKTQVFNGLAHNEVKCLVALAKLFKSMNNHGNSGFGGGSWHYPGGDHKWRIDIMAAYDEVMAQYEGSLSPLFLETWWPEVECEVPLQDMTEAEANTTFDGYRECIIELVGYPEDDFYGNGDYIRVYDSHTVHYYQESIPDVTTEFK